jgi:tRNA(Ile2) C34 agmatinyltransferase TiaS
MAAKFKVVDRKAEDKLDYVIKKTNFAVDFTLREMHNDMEYNKRMKRELEGKLQIESATMENVKRNHPFVLEMDDEKMAAVYIYFKSKCEVHAIENKLLDFEIAIKDGNREIGEIAKQTGLNMIVVDKKPAEKPGENQETKKE